MSGNLLDDVHELVITAGVKKVSEKADLNPRYVKQFLEDPNNTRLSTFQRIARAVGVVVGPICIVDLDSGVCLSGCGDPLEAHYPLMPEDEEQMNARSDV